MAYPQNEQELRLRKLADLLALNSEFPGESMAYGEQRPFVDAPMVEPPQMERPMDRPMPQSGFVEKRMRDGSGKVHVTGPSQFNQPAPQYANQDDQLNALMQKVSGMMAPGYQEAHPDMAYSSRIYAQGVPDVQNRPEFQQLKMLMALKKGQAEVAKAQREAKGDPQGEYLQRLKIANELGIDPATVPDGSGRVTINLDQSGAQQQFAALNQKMLERKFGKAPANHRWDAQGAAIPIPGIEKPLTEFQGKASGYGARAAVAHEVINAVGQDGEVQQGLIKRAAESTPLVGDGLGTMMNWTQSDEQQQVEQAQRDFVNAVLRQESGAAISEGEFANAKKQYFPQPGDSSAVILQKKQNREQAIAGFTASAGRDGQRLITNSKEKVLMLFDAKKAIKDGADPEKVRERLESMGITNSGI